MYHSLKVHGNYAKGYTACLLYPGQKALSGRVGGTCMAVAGGIMGEGSTLFQG